MGSYKYIADTPSIKTVLEPISECISAQKEIGGEQGFPHIQFFIKTKKPMRFTEVRSHLIDAKVQLPIWLRGVDGRDKVEIAKCVRYCQKQDETAVPDTKVLVGFSTDPEAAVPDKKGRRTDMQALRAYVLQKKGDIDILDGELTGDLLQMMAQFPRFVAQLQSRAMGEERRPDAVMMCFWGDTGTGKTARAHLVAKEMGYKSFQIYVKQAMTTWWDGYDASVHRVVIVDELRPLSKDLTSMYLGELNKGKITSQQVKGGMTPLKVDLWIFTSPFHPEQWIWCPDGVDKSQQFTRRFGKHIYHFTKPFIHPEGNACAATAQLPENVQAILSE